MIHGNNERAQAPNPPGTAGEVLTTTASDSSEIVGEPNGVTSQQYLSLRDGWASIVLPNGERRPLPVSSPARPSYYGNPTYLIGREGTSSDLEIQSTLPGRYCVLSGLLPSNADAVSSLIGCVVQSLNHHELQIDLLPGATMSEGFGGFIVTGPFRLTLLCDSPGDTPYEIMVLATAPGALNDVLLTKGLGAGAQGSVFEADVTVHDGVIPYPVHITSCAIKIRRRRRGRTDKELVASLAIQAAGEHQHVVKIFGTNISDGSAPYSVISMEKWAGTLRSCMGITNGRLLKIVLSQIMDGMGHLHRNLIVHGDPKPPNILVNRTDYSHPDFKLAIADFGSTVKLIRADERLRKKYATGTPAFQAPEIDFRFNGPLGAVLKRKTRRNDYDGFKADSFAVGMICYLMAGTAEVLLHPARKDVKKVVKTIDHESVTDECNLYHMVTGLLEPLPNVRSLISARHQYFVSQEKAPMMTRPATLKKTQTDSVSATDAKAAESSRSSRAVKRLRR